MTIRRIDSFDPLALCVLRAVKHDSLVLYPGGSLFFTFADLVIHSILNTNAQAWPQNDVSSCLNLRPLYGRSQADVDWTHRKDGMGCLLGQYVRLLMMLPSICAMLVLISHNRNFIAETILSINERGAFMTTPWTDKAKRRMQDEETCQRARLANAAFFMQIVLCD